MAGIIGLKQKGMV